MKVAISIGHHPLRPGITNKGRTEHSEMAPIAGFLIQTLIYNGHKPYIIGSGPLPHKVEQVNALKADCAIEMHLNSGGGHGCECLYCPGSEDTLATDLQRAVVDAGYNTLLRIPISDRGVKEGWYKMQVGGDKNFFLEHTNCPACITEMYFLDNSMEFAKFAGNTDFYRAMAVAVATGLMTWNNRR